MKIRGSRSISLAVLFMCSTLLQASTLLADPVTVRHTEGLTHGFLVLQTLDGNTIADGDLTQVAAGDRVTDHLLFHFKDGSIYEETFTFTQRGTFRLLSDDLVQKGPAFKQPIHTSINASTGRVTSRYTENDGKEKVVTEQMQLPPDVSNGMIPILLKNLQPGALPMKVSMVAATPKPRLVKLAISLAGDEPFSAGGSGRQATHYVVKVEIGGAAGVVAPIIGQQPPDTNVWVFGGDAPVFLKSEGPLYDGGPIWRLESVSPVWSQPSLQK